MARSWNPSLSKCLNPRHSLALRADMSLLLDDMRSCHSSMCLRLTPQHMRGGVVRVGDNDDGDFLSAIGWAHDSPSQIISSSCVTIILYSADS